MRASNIDRPLWLRLSAFGFAAVVFTSAAIGFQSWYNQANMGQRALELKANSDLALIENDIAGIQRSAAAIAMQIAVDPEVPRLIETNDRSALLEKYSGPITALKKKFNLPLSSLFDAKGTAIARVHAPEKFGDNVIERRKTVRAALETGQLAVGMEQGIAGDIGLYAVAPVIKDDKVVGAVDIGTMLKHSYFDPLAAQLGSQIAVDALIGGKFVTQASSNGGKPLASPTDIQAGFDGKPVSEAIFLNGHNYVVKVIPLKNFTGQKIGVYQIAADSTDIVAANHAALRNTLIGAFVVALISVLGFFAFSRSLSGTIRRLTDTMSHLAAGDLSQTVDAQTRRDEIGAMARAVQVFKDNAVKTEALERQTEEQRSLTEEQRQRNAEEARIRAEAMAEATNGLATGLKHLSAGDLTFQLERAFAQDFESLRADFNAAVTQLRGTLGSVAQATSSIDSGSREISQSADDLSKRTEQQAASLEETAAALDQITTNVANSYRRTEEARSIAIQANESARQSGAVVANAVDAMGRIEESSGQIGNIIGVIDDIAFQTNLLALNAGVEAARAGEAGKGFAVVAQEVRELAQRSAKAAKEIKDLIRNSSVEVETGVKLVSETGTALKTIENYIVSINQHMDAIAISSREQSVGLAEVNTAVNQMDQVTQQNAAMVEEANAAGATLANEAGRLRDLIAEFQLGDSSRQAVALQRTASVMVASHTSLPVASPARSMIGKVARALGGARKGTAVAEN